MALNSKNTKRMQYNGVKKGNIKNIQYRMCNYINEMVKNTNYIIRKNQKKKINNNFKKGGRRIINIYKIVYTQIIKVL